MDVGCIVLWMGFEVSLNLVGVLLLNSLGSFLLAASLSVLQHFFQPILHDAGPLAELAVKNGRVLQFHDITPWVSAASIKL